MVHLARCVATDLTALLGEATMTLLERVGKDAIVPSGLAELVVHVFGEAGTLRHPEIRRLLFEKLTPEEGRHLCGLLNVATYAPASTLTGVDFKNDQLNSDLLMRFYNVADDGGGALDEPTQNATAGQQLRTHQVNAYRKLRRIITDPTATALVHMPFGAGKIRTVATAVLDLYRSEGDGRVVLWVAAGDALCEKVFTELKLVWQQLGSRNVTAYRIYGAHQTPDLDKIENGIIVADVERLLEKEEGLIELGGRTRALVLGDAELLNQPTVSGVVEVMARGGDFSVIGISASPASVINARETLKPLATKFSGNCISMEDSKPTESLNAAGDVDPISVEVRAIKSIEGTASVVTGVDLSAAYLKTLSEDVERNHDLLELLLAESRSASAQIIFYATTAEHARLFAGLLRLRGVRSTALTGRMPIEQRTLALQKFVARDDKILCVYDCFIAGGEIPNVSTAVLARPTTMSAFVYEMVGRLATGRCSPQNPLKVVVIGDQVADYLKLAEGLSKWDALKI